MPDQLTATGLEIDTLDTRTANLIAEIRSRIAANEDLSVDTPNGQLIRIFAEALQNVAELLQVVHGAFDPDQATGLLLRAMCALTGTVPRNATYGTVTLTVNLDGGTTLPAGSIATVGTDADNAWVTDINVVAPAGPPANYTVAATCQLPGAIQALAGTIDTIATPVAGWNTVTNVSDATPGQAAETDIELRQRRQDEVTVGGSTSTESIRANLSQVDGVENVVVYENASIIPDPPMPPKSLWAVVWDGSPPAAANADIAEAIWETKAAGIDTYGSTSAAHIDSQGVSHTVNFDRVTLTYILVSITIGGKTSDYVGDAAVKTAIAALINGLAVGAAIRRSDIVRVVEGLAGVDWIDLSAGPLLSRKPAAVGAADIVLVQNEKAYIQVTAADITVVS